MPRSSLNRVQRWAVASLVAAMIAMSAACGTQSGEATTSKTLSAELQSKLIPDGARIISNPKSPRATLVLFTDYQCPYCAMMDTHIGRAKQDYGSQVKIVIRNFPLAKHPNAVLAAQAVESAAEQGMMEPMASAMFARQAEWESITSDQTAIFTGYARDLGLDMARFVANLSSAAIVGRVQRDFNDALALGLQKTPSVILNGELLATDSKKYETISVPISQALAR